MTTFPFTSLTPWERTAFMGFPMKEYPMPSGGFPVPWSDEREVEPPSFPGASLGQEDDDELNHMKKPNYTMLVVGALGVAFMYYLLGSD